MPAVTRAITIVATVLFAAGTVLLAAMAVPGIAAIAPGWLAPWAEPTAWWPLLLQVLLAGLAFGSWWWRHRRSQRSLGLVALAVATGSVVVLGVGSYVACSAPGLAAGWTAVIRVLGLVLNSYETGVFGTEPGCAAGVPPALQMARLTLLVILVVGATRAVVALARNQADRVIARLRRDKLLVTGLDAETLPVLSKLVADAPAGREVVVLTPDAGASWLRAARTAGARVVIADPAEAEALRPLLLLGRRLALSGLTLLAPDAAANLAVLRTVETITASAAGAGGPPIRALVRIDDPWQAEDWRRRRIAAAPPWIYDAIGVHEVAARLLAERLAGRDRIVVCGRSPLVLALCAEFAQLARERAVLGETTATPGITLFDPDAEALLTEHRLRQGRFGNSEGQAVAAVGSVPDHAGIARLFEGAGSPAVVFAAPPGSGGDALATHLAAIEPGWLLLAWRTATTGIAAEPVMAQLHAFGPGIDAGAERPLDSWERIARLAHERYRRANPGNTGDSGAPWAQLPEFYQQSNVRQITTTLQAAVAADRTWGAVTDGVAEQEPSAEQLELMARLEHESWCRQYRAAGWRWGSERDRARKRHPDLLEWAALPETSREKTREGVRASLQLLATLGYHSLPDPRRVWRDFERSGEVSAERLSAPWSWRLHDGTPLRAQAGDWRVGDETGRRWSVAPDAFAASYTQVADGRWARTGTVQARRAHRGELVRTLEGDVLAGEGDWIVRGTAGEQWPVTAEQFALNYSAVEQATAVDPGR